MTDENDDFDPENPTESLTDVADALESEGHTPDADDEAEGDDEDSSGLPGPLSAIEGLSGTGKSLESYEDSPIASALGDDDSKGAKHIARGIDGLSPIGAMNPLIDIGIGVVLLSLEGNDGDGGNSEGTDLDKAGPAADPTESRDNDLT